MPFATLPPYSYAVVGNYSARLGALRGIEHLPGDQGARVYLHWARDLDEAQRLCADIRTRGLPYRFIRVMPIAADQEAQHAATVGLRP
jgi:hypothetical protein